MLIDLHFLLTPTLLEGFRPRCHHQGGCGCAAHGIPPRPTIVRVRARTLEPTPLQNSPSTSPFPGEIIYRRGDASDYLYLIKKGTLVSRRLVDANLMFLGKGKQGEGEGEGEDLLHLRHHT